MHYVRNEGTALAYQLIGDGPADLFVAIGYLSNLEYAWEIPPNAAFFRRLAATRRLILMDRRGSGLSDRFSPSDAPLQETLVEDVRVVLDAAGSARTALLGLWDGCMTATLFAATYPERVTSLILFIASPAGLTSEDLPGNWDEDQWEEWLTSVRLGWGTRADGAARAIRCARRMLDSTPEDGISIRAAVHTGEIEVVGDDVLGVAVHEAARVAALAAEGEVLVTAVTRDLAAGVGLSFGDRGDHELRGFDGPRRLFAVGGASSAPGGSGLMTVRRPRGQRDRSAVRAGRSRRIGRPGDRVRRRPSHVALRGRDGSRQGDRSIR